MRSILYRVFILSFVIFNFSCAYAQSSKSSIEEKIKQRAAQKVGLLGEYISTIADKEENNLQTRLRFCEKALSLFIEKGNSYEENGILRKGVTMETTSVSRKDSKGNYVKNRSLIKNYFNGLANLRYASVKIETTEVADIKVSNLNHVADDVWVCTCVIEQAFKGYNGEGRLIYVDVTKKAVKCYVIRQELEVIEEDGSRYEYMVLLGDVTAIETVKSK